MEVCVVLVRARNAGNIGAAARAMQDFGFADLRVVNEYSIPLEAARAAVDADDVLRNAKVCASVAEAVADCTLVIGTTAVGERVMEHELLTLKEAAVRMEGKYRVAILFGSEKTGLSNEELSYCHWLMTIPMQAREGRHLSMNLGQAVAVCLYELVRGNVLAEAGPHSEESTATAAEMENLTAVLEEVLEASEYTRRHPSNSDPVVMRRLVMRLGFHAGDARVWLGILRQVLWKLKRD
jgi:TrmH family RNA methyltransferase